LQNLGNLVGETFAMSVLFGYSKRDDVSQNEAFSVAAIIIAALGLPVFCLVRNPKIKEGASEDPSTVIRLEEQERKHQLLNGEE